MILGRDDYENIQGLISGRPVDMPGFLFTAGDKFMVTILKWYHDKLLDAGASKEIRDSVKAHIELTLKYQEDNIPKMPDLPEP